MSELSVVTSQTHTSVHDLPLEMLETVLMRTFVKLYSSDFKGDDDRHPYVPGKSSQAESRAFTLLASVSSSWHHTLTGWPQSPTGRWLKHQLKKLIERSCRPFQRLAKLDYVYQLDVEHVFRLQFFFNSVQLCEVESVTELRDIVYILCSRSSTILRFNATTRQRLTDINVDGFVSPHDIAACLETSQVYVTDWECVWRVSADGTDIRRWLPTDPSVTIKPWTLSVRSTRLLVTSPDVKQLIQFNAGGNELCRVQLPSYVVPRHAVESPTGTFIVSYSNTELDQDQVSEVNTGGELLRQFSSSHLRWPNHLDVDSHGNIFLSDTYSHRILLFSSKLVLRRVIVDDRQLNCKPLRGLCYVEQTGRLLVPLDNGIAVFSVLSC